MSHTDVDTVVVGGGQAGLAMGYHLARAGRDFLILEAAPSPGTSWRGRWDSLRLFTPAEHSGLPGMPFPARRGYFPGKDEVADYLEAYALRFRLPVRTHTRVRWLECREGGFHLETEREAYRARRVVVATGPFQEPARPPFAGGLASTIRQLHTAEYRSPEGLPPGEVLVVGGGNSGLQIAAELAATRRVTLSAGGPATILPRSLLGVSIFQWLSASGLMDLPVTSPLGRRASTRQLLVGSSPERLLRDHAVRVVPRVVGSEDGGLRVAGGAVLHPDVVVWATGFRTDFSWIWAPVFGLQGEVLQRRGITPVPGLGFLGLSWLHTRGSALLGWVGRDAAWLAANLEVGGHPARASRGARTG